MTFVILQISSIFCIFIFNEFDYAKFYVIYFMLLSNKWFLSSKFPNYYQFPGFQLRTVAYLASVTTQVRQTMPIHYPRTVGARVLSDLRMFWPGQPIVNAVSGEFMSVWKPNLHHKERFDLARHASPVNEAARPRVGPPWGG